MHSYRATYMLYIESMTLHNFKSFKYAKVDFKKGFNCVVGPNGSGKSALCDALLFAMGEMSLNRMRVQNSSELISYDGKQKRGAGPRHASVKVEFGGGQKVEVTRSISMESGISYRLDGKSVSRQEVIELLKSHRSNIDDTNTLAQGEIGKFLNMKPRERRELIDVAAGVKEFDDKRDAAMKELERVDARINEASLIMNERIGFMRSLEKEKNEALQYTALNNKLKQLHYSLLKQRETQLTREYQDIAANNTGNLKTSTELHAALKQLDQQITALNADRKAISDRLNQRSVEVSQSNKILEQLNRDVALNESRLAYLDSTIGDYADRTSSLNQEASKINAQLSENQKNYAPLKKTLDQKDRLLNAQQSRMQGYAAQIKSYDAYIKNIEQLSASAAQLDNALTKHKVELENIAARLQDINQEQSALEQQMAHGSNVNKELSQRAKQLEEARQSLVKTLGSSEQQLSALQDDIDKISLDVMGMRAALASSGSDKALDALKSSLKSGFHGRASELCSYDDKYSNAVNAAGGARLNYFVVDSIDDAAEAVAMLKSRNLGRASFIPLNELTIGRQEPEKSMDPVIGHISFDNKYQKVFSYIFANTYMIARIADAKSKLGKNRFVTLDGELVEPTGIVTGGSIKALPSYAALSSKISKSEQQRNALLGRQSGLKSSIHDARRQLAAQEAEALKVSMELKQLNDAERSASDKIKSLRSQSAGLEGHRQQLSAAIKQLNTAKSAVDAELKTQKTNAPHAELGEKQPAGEKSTIAVEQFNALKQEAEELRVRCASILKEDEMLNARGIEVNREAAKLKQDAASLGKERRELQLELEQRRAGKQQMEEKIKGHDKQSGSLFKQLSQIDELLSSAGVERGSKAASLEKAERAVMELESAKAQLEQRLGDIKAELVSYDQVEVMELSINDLEQQINAAKHSIEKLGAVNLKAPEVYEQRTAEMRDSVDKLETLRKEKESVLAMISQIEAKKFDVFMQVFNSIDQHFSKLYNHIFSSKASLLLESQTRPFESGLGFNIEMNGRKLRSEEELSGGQKSLVMLMLVFAIQRVSPKSFYIFDEIDAALDKENSKNLSKLIKQLSSESQFIVVSHNDPLITEADTAMGVLKSGDESQIVGIEVRAIS